ncbi:GH15 family glucan-1,4-alpha-glucosidase [Arthrobacter sp. GAS37]|uniref:glycoside hydrolase family 15 protein n=1 Tax=Arthrobacter sp. GAS37 TaxID=3156261 RepID=UPI0038367894
MAFIRRVRTASGATGVQIAEYVHGRQRIVEAVIGVGQRREAKELFERLLALRNDVGLLSEEWEVETGRQLGNTPQAFSHFALVMSPLDLHEGSVHRSDVPVRGR